jgi:hypothetical protein
MTVVDPRWCTAISAAEGEALAGSASRLRHWLMVEQPGPWGHDALLEGALPVDVGRRLKEAGDNLGVRVLLIQRRDRPNPARRRCFAAFTGRKERRLATFEVDDARELLELDIGGLVRTHWRGFGEPLGRPLILVCTHGKHDQCCARYGGPVSRALAHRPDVWECSHIGGDRFAGNVVCFPEGLYFGRVTADSATGVVDAYQRGSISLEHFRGRSSYAPAVQAAEHELRSSLGLVRVDEVDLEQHARLTRGRHRIVFRIGDGETRTVEVTESTSSERPLTCKALHPHAPRTFVLERIS